LSPVAKSAQRPVRRFTLNEPARLSARVGFRATHSLPCRRPSGSHLRSNAVRCGRAAEATAEKSTECRLTGPFSGRGKRCFRACERAQTPRYPRSDRCSVRLTSDTGAPVLATSIAQGCDAKGPIFVRDPSGQDAESRAGNFGYLVEGCCSS
jgi:hypothetical protein